MAALPSDGSLIVRESALQRDGLFAFLVLAFAVALARGATGASTTTGRMVVLVVFGLGSIGLLIVWVKRRRRAQWLEVSEQSIELRDPNDDTERRLVRTPATQLRFVVLGSARARSLGVGIDGTDQVLPLHFFNKKAVRAACLARGWTFV